MNIHIIFFLISITIVGLTSQAQTPYDSFADNTSDVKILDNERDESFKAINRDTNAKIRYVKFDINRHELSYFSKNDSLVFVAHIDYKEIKWLSLDPYSSKYPNLSPFNFCENSPLFLIDRKGDSTVYVNKKGDILLTTLEKEDNLLVVVNNASVFRLQRAYMQLFGLNPESSKVKKNLLSSGTVHNLTKIFEFDKSNATQYGEAATLLIKENNVYVPDLGKIKKNNTGVVDFPPNPNDNPQLHTHPISLRNEANTGEYQVRPSSYDEDFHIHKDPSIVVDWEDQERKVRSVHVYGTKYPTNSPAYEDTPQTFKITQDYFNNYSKAKELFDEAIHKK